MKLSTLEKKLIDLPKKISEWCDLIIKDNVDLIISFNQMQLKEGVGEDENKIAATGSGGGYRPFTIRQRKKLGLQTSVVDLRVTGQLWGHIRLKKKATNVWQFLNDDPELKEKLKFVTKNNFGLTNEHKEKLEDIIAEELEQYLRGYFNG